MTSSSINVGVSISYYTFKLCTISLNLILSLQREKELLSIRLPKSEGYQLQSSS